MEQVISINELLLSVDRRKHAAMPEIDPLVEADALQEADLVDVRFDACTSSLAMLLDLRTSLQFRLANTALLVLRDINEFHWGPSEAQARRVAHYVMSSRPGVVRNRFSLEVVCLRGWRLSAAASSAEFFAVDIPTLSGAPPNFVEDDEQTVAAGMPDWHSLLNVGWATFLDPPERTG